MFNSMSFLYFFLSASPMLMTRFFLKPTHQPPEICLIDKNGQKEGNIRCRINFVSPNWHKKKIFQLRKFHFHIFILAVKPLNRGQLQVLKNWSVIERCMLLGLFFYDSRFVCYLGCPPLGGFIVLQKGIFPVGFCEILIAQS